MSTRRRWVAPIAVAVAYAGLAAALAAPYTWLASSEYHHDDQLEQAIVEMCWAVLAIGCLSSGATGLVLTFGEVRRWLRWATIGLSVPIALAAPAALLNSILGFQGYEAGLAAYGTAVQVCGHPPVLASDFLEKTYLRPGDSDYDRQKYSPEDTYLLGRSRYFCTPAEAESRGYRSVG